MNVTVSDNFKKMTTKAILSIAMFIGVYGILLVLGLLLTALCIYLSIILVIALPHFVTGMLGVGLASVGIFILIFLIKFVFKRHKVDRSHLTEITREQEPKLFQFIQEIVDEVKTDFPKRVYLSTDVNAAVFYDSSFWSMFFPIRKNLQIGLGLVSTISEQEFKAILAHEFGHFSQRSMKVGSYVYTANQVIYNMLYDNESFESMIQKWANLSNYFSIFMVVAIKVIQGIQFVLKKMYEYINISYMALSREMEFHADEVAAHIAGYEPLKESLLRMNLADHAFNRVLSFYESKIKDNIRSKNLYQEQRFVMNFLGKENDLPFRNNLPVVTEEEYKKYQKSKLVIKDQWASHPSVEERIVALEKLGIKKEASGSDSAFSLFIHPDTIQEMLTDKVFSHVNYEGKVANLDPKRFEYEFIQSFNENNFNKEYNGYYDNKNPNVIDLEDVMPQNSFVQFDDLFSKDKVDVLYQYLALLNDKVVLEKISANEYDVKTFDYDGKKYTKDQTSEVLQSLEKEGENLKNRIAQNDQFIYQFFYEKAKKVGKEQELKNSYKDFLEYDTESDKQFELHARLVSDTSFVNIVTPYDSIIQNFDNILPLEQELKKHIGELLVDDLLQKEITPEMRENFTQYLSHSLEYFKDQTYNDDNLQIFFSALRNFQYLVMRKYMLMKMNLLNFQTDILSK